MDRLTDNNTLSAKLPYLYGAIACVALYISYTVSLICPLAMSY